MPSLWARLDSQTTSRAKEVPTMRIALLEQTKVERGETMTEENMPNKPDLVQIINRIAEEVNTVLDAQTEDKYFQEIVLLQSFIENILIWLVWVEVMWKKSTPKYIEEQQSVNKVSSFCQGLNFYQAVNLAFTIDLVKPDLYIKLDSIRAKRNDFIHQLWLYKNRDQIPTLRTELETLASTSSQLVAIVNRLTKKTGLGGELNTVYLRKWAKAMKRMGK